MHDPSQLVDGVYMFESFIINSQRMPAPEGFEDLPDGSWFGSYKVDNEAVWNEIKAGTFKGFSVEGMFIFGTQSGRCRGCYGIFNRSNY